MRCNTNAEPVVIVVVYSYAYINGIHARLWRANECECVCACVWLCTNALAHDPLRRRIRLSYSTTRAAQSPEHLHTHPSASASIAQQHTAMREKYPSAHFHMHFPTLAFSHCVVVVALLANTSKIDVSVVRGAYMHMHACMRVRCRWRWRQPRRRGETASASKKISLHRNHHAQ